MGLNAHFIRSLRNAARYEPAFCRDLSNKLKDFLLCIGGEVQKMTEKWQNLRQLSTAQFSGVLQAF